MKALVLALGCLVWVFSLNAELLLPPNLNLAEDASITASSTCGEKEVESYFKMAGLRNSNGINGDFCEPENSSDPLARAHPAKFALDNSENWWQSPSLGEGEQYHEVNLTIDLGQEFSVEWIHITMANSPRPKAWVLEGRNDNGASWGTWQYFAENESECKEHFGNLEDGVTCNTRFSHVEPHQNGEILFPVQTPQQYSPDDDWNLDVWRRATNIRLRFLRLHTNWPEDLVIDTKGRYFYAVKNIKIGGRCACNGHSNKCKPWRNYMECQDCQHNTCGDQCWRCCSGYFRPEGSTGFETCQPCNCNKVGSWESNFCTPKKGQCMCKPGFEGRQCDKITDKPWSLQEFLNVVALD